jgi:ribose 5-phosphate isomerase B
VSERRSDVYDRTRCVAVLDIVDAYLNAELGSGYEWWHNFYEFHKLAIDELEAFDYEEYKANGFKVNKLGDFDIKLEKKPE